MQYVGQTGQYLKTRFREHFRKMKKPNKITIFFIAIFEYTGHLLIEILIKHLVNIISSIELKENILRYIM